MKKKNRSLKQNILSQLPNVAKSQLEQQLFDTETYASSHALPCWSSMATWQTGSDTGRAVRKQIGFMVMFSCSCYLKLELEAH